MVNLLLNVFAIFIFTRFLIYFLFLSDEGPMLETIEYTIRIGSTPIFLYFDLYLYTANTEHYVYIYIYIYTLVHFGVIEHSVKFHWIPMSDNATRTTLVEV